MKPASLWDLYAFASNSTIYRNTDPKVRLHAEYLRLLRPPIIKNQRSSNKVREAESCEYWRISEANSIKLNQLGWWVALFVL